MNNLLRLLVIVGLAAWAIAMPALGLERHNADLLAPFNLLLFVAGLLVYVLPTGLAIYRDCKSTAWIVVVNLLLGWTLFGWFVALGWAAGGKIREPFHPSAPPPIHPVPSH
ncbi:MAG: superinfection immunity protein [Terriglobia bacterium]